MNGMCPGRPCSGRPKKEHPWAPGMGQAHPFLNRTDMRGSAVNACASDTFFGLPVWRGTAGCERLCSAELCQAIVVTYIRAGYERAAAQTNDDPKAPADVQAEGDLIE